MADSPNTPSMPKIHSSRRGALVGLAGALTAATGITCAVAVRSARGEDNPDGELIALCEAFRNQWRYWCNATVDEIPDDDTYNAYGDAHIYPVLAQIEAIRPITHEGWAAKAHALADYADLDEDNDCNIRTVMTFMRQLAGAVS